MERTTGTKIQGREAEGPIPDRQGKGDGKNSHRAVREMEREGTATEQGRGRETQTGTQVNRKSHRWTDGVMGEKETEKRRIRDKGRS